MLTPADESVSLALINNDYTGYEDGICRTILRGYGWDGTRDGLLLAGYNLLVCADVQEFVGVLHSK